MATLSTADFEEGSHGAAMVAPSGWANLGSGVTYDSGTAAHGSLSMRCGGSSAGGITWDMTSLPHFRLRMYVRVGSEAQTNHAFLLDMRDSGGGNLADLQIRNTGGGQLWNRWGFNAYTDTQAFAYTRDQWRRIDYEFRWQGTGNEYTRAHVYDPADDTVVQDVLEVPSFAQPVSLRVGAPQSGGLYLNFDSLELTDGADPGPFVAPSSGPTFTVYNGTSEVTPTSVKVWDGSAEVDYTSAEIQ